MHTPNLMNTNQVVEEDNNNKEDPPKQGHTFRHWARKKLRYKKLICKNSVKSMYAIHLQIWIDFTKYLCLKVIFFSHYSALIWRNILCLSSFSLIFFLLLNLNLQDPETLGTLGYDLLLLLLCSEDTPRECAKSLDFAKKQFSFKWSFQRSELCKSSYTLNHPSEIST